MPYLLLVLHSLTIALGLFFYRRQKGPSAMGGTISKPKVFWLFFAILNYYFITWVVMWFSETEILYRCLLAFAILFLFRAVLQMCIMYLYKSWQTQYGVLFNLLGVAIIIIGWIDISVAGSAALRGVEVWFTGFWVIMLLLDSYYAVKFNELVSAKTKGDDAIWFANQSEPRFERLNRITKWNNVVLFAIYCYLIIRLIYEYS